MSPLVRLGEVPPSLDEVEGQGEPVGAASRPCQSLIPRRAGVPDVGEAILRSLPPTPVEGGVRTGAVPSLLGPRPVSSPLTVEGATSASRALESLSLI